MSPEEESREKKDGLSPPRPGISSRAARIPPPRSRLMCSFRRSLSARKRSAQITASATIGKQITDVRMGISTGRASSDTVGLGGRRACPNKGGVGIVVDGHLVLAITVVAMELVPVVSSPPPMSLRVRLRAARMANTGRLCGPPCLHHSLSGDGSTGWPTRRRLTPWPKRCIRLFGNSQEPLCSLHKIVRRFRAGRWRQKHHRREITAEYHVSRRDRQ